MAHRTERILCEDPLSGITTYFIMEEGAKEFTLAHRQIEDAGYAAHNHRERTSHSTKAPQQWKGDMHKVASIPMVVYHELQQKGIDRDQAEMKRWLNKAENQVFRTKPGKV